MLCRIFVVNLVILMTSAGLIFRDGPSPLPNTEVAPTGRLAGSGWEHQVYYLNYHGTVISPKHVVTARHLGAAEDRLTRPVIFGGDEEETFAIKGERILIGDTDLAIFEVWETFPSFAPLYRGNDEIGREVVIHGSGVGRGEEISGKGWRWGRDETRQSRWGRNVIKGELDSGPHRYLYFSFDDLPGQSEAAATRGDSGGGWFIREEGEWRLAALSSTVDSRYSASSEPANANGFRGSFFEAGGLFYGDDEEGWEMIPGSGSSDQPGEIAFYRQSHSYGSRLSPWLPEIEAVIASALAWEALEADGKFANWLEGYGVTEHAGTGDDADGDGLTNLEEYFAESHPGEASHANPALRMEHGPEGRHRIILRESLDRVGRELGAVLESSSDCRVWEEVEELKERARERNNRDGFQERILEGPSPGEDRFFYRLRLRLGVPGS